MAYEEYNYLSLNFEYLNYYETVYKCFPVDLKTTDTILFVLNHDTSMQDALFLFHRCW